MTIRHPATRQSSCPGKDPRGASDAQASQGTQEVDENVNQRSTVAGEITSDIAVVNQSSGEIATSSDQVKVSAEDLKRMATELNGIVGSFRI